MVGKAREWFNGDKATNEWLSATKKSSRNTYRSQWKRFLDYVGKTGDQILAERKADKNYTWEKKVIEFRRWLIEKQGLSPNTATTAGGAVRSFFSYHRAELKFRRAESKSLSESRRKTEDYRFSRDDLKKMADVADLEEKYVVVVGKSFGLRAGDFLALTRGDLEPYIDREVPISIGEIGTRKESVKANPFIDVDAKPVIKLMLDRMSRKGRTDPSERMLTHKHTIQLSRVLKRLAERAGIESGNKIVRFHNLRKFLIDRLSSVMSESKWKQIVGKAISEGAYVSADSLREDYRRAMEETCFTKSVSEQQMQLLAKKQAAMMLLKLQGTTEEEMKKIFRSRKVKALADEVKVLEEMIDELKKEQEQQQDTNNCSDGHNCQRIVSEEELPQLLSKHWHVAAVLPSGKVVISND
jgi:integrase